MSRRRSIAMRLLTTKPVLYCCNVGEDDLPEGNAWVDTVRASGRTRRGRGRRGLRGRSRRSSPASTGTTSAELLGLYGLAEPALHNARARAAIACSACRATSRLVRRRSAPGRSGSATPRRRPPAVIHTDFETRLHPGQRVHPGRPAQRTIARRPSAPRASCGCEGKEYVVQDGDIMPLPVQRLSRGRRAEHRRWPMGIRRWASRRAQPPCLSREPPTDHGTGRPPR